MNDELNFMSKSYCSQTTDFDKLFNLSRLAVWFIEKKETHEWLMDNGRFTNDPLKAKSFSSEISALTHIFRNKMNPELYWPTEHKFV